MDPHLTELNEKFISLVKNRPDLYKHRFRKDRDQAEVDRLWREISAQMPWKGEKECRYRWGVLRNCYARALREEGNSKYSVKPWYLQEQMSFLKPYIKTYKNCSMEGHSTKKPNRSASASKSPSSKPKKKNIIDSSCFLPSSVQQFSISEMELNETENTQIDESYTKLDNIGTLSVSVDEASNSSRISIKSSPMPFTERFLDESVFETKALEQQQVDFELSNNSNKLFLTSLLPDLNKLSERKQRMFKRKTLELLETLFDEPAHNSSLPIIQHYGHLYDQNSHLGLNQ